MNKDIAILQNIAETLKVDPCASQRKLAENAEMSIGLMNAVIKRFVERGWIMLTNVNLRKLSYAITPIGIAELSARSQLFVKRTLFVANKYNEILLSCVSDAKQKGKRKVCLYGDSYIKFLLIYACQNLNVSFIQKDVTDSVETDAFCVVGEHCDEDAIKELANKGCVNLLKLLEE